MTRKQQGTEAGHGTLPPQVRRATTACLCVHDEELPSPLLPMPSSHVVQGFQWQKATANVTSFLFPHFQMGRPQLKGKRMLLQPYHSLV